MYCRGNSSIGVHVQLSPRVLFALTILMLVAMLYVYCKVRAALLKLKCLFKVCKCCKCLLCACGKQVNKRRQGTDDTVGIDEAVPPPTPQFSTEAASNPMSGMVVEGSQYSGWN